MDSNQDDSDEGVLDRPAEPANEGSRDARLVTLDHLRTLVAVCNAGGFYQAAGVLNLTQPSVTHRIKQLESHLGCKLLKRTKGGFVGMTPAGSRYLAVARNVLHELDQAAHTLEHPELCGLVRIGVPDDFLGNSIQACIQAYHSEMPAIRISVMSGLSSPLLGAFHEKSLDVVVVRVLESANELAFAAKQEDWGAEPLCWVANRAIDFNEFNDLPLVLFPDGSVYRQAALTALARYGKPFLIVFSSSSHDQVRRAILEGQGVAVLRSTAVVPGQVVLNEEHGFPPLPAVRLMMGLREAVEVYQRAPDILHDAWRADRSALAPWAATK